MELISQSKEQTEQIAFEYAKQLNKGDVVLLSGDMGAGKTVFVKGVAKYFGLSGVTSPTYAYLNVYGDLIYHYDCYRLSCGEDAERLGLTDYFGGDNICSDYPDELPQPYRWEYRLHKQVPHLQAGADGSEFHEPCSPDWRELAKYTTYPAALAARFLLFLASSPIKK